MATQRGIIYPTDYTAVADIPSDLETMAESIDSAIGDVDEAKVDKVSGKGLSTNDYDNTEKGKVASNTEARHTHSNKSLLDGITASYTTEEATKLAGIDTGAEVNTIETVKVNGTALTPTEKAVNIPVPTKVSDLTDDSGHYTKPSGGIPKTDLAEAVQTSLEKADSAIQDTDYATSNKGGVIKSQASNNFSVNSGGTPYAENKTYEQYQAQGNSVFIGKGTLEAVITGKQLTDKTYVDGLVGDIESILEELDIGGGV